MTCSIIFPFLWVVSLKYPYSIANEEAHAQPLSECPRGWRSCSASDANPPPWHVATILPSMLQMQTKYTNPSEIKPGKLQKKNSGFRGKTIELSWGCSRHVWVPERCIQRLTMCWVGKLIMFPSGVISIVSPRRRTVMSKKQLGRRQTAPLKSIHIHGYGTHPRTLQNSRQGSGCLSPYSDGPVWPQVLTLPQIRNHSEFSPLVLVVWWERKAGRTRKQRPPVLSADGCGWDNSQGWDSGQDIGFSENMVPHILMM